MIKKNRDHVITIKLSITPSDVNQQEQRRQRGGRRRKDSPRREDTVKHRIALSDDVFDVIDSERKPGETWNDVIVRLLKERTKLIVQLQRQLDKILKSETLDQYIPKPATPAAVLQMTPLTIYQ